MRKLEREGGRKREGEISWPRIFPFHFLSFSSQLTDPTAATNATSTVSTIHTHMHALTITSERSDILCFIVHIGTL